MRPADVRHLVLTCVLGACALTAPPRSSVAPSVAAAPTPATTPPTASRSASRSAPRSAPPLHASWPATSCAPGAAFARLRASCDRASPDPGARLAHAVDAWRHDDATASNALLQAAADVFCASPDRHSRRRARGWLIDNLVIADPVRAAAVTADVLDELDAERDPEALHGELVGLGLAERVIDATTPPACQARLRARIDALHARACEVDSPRQFRTRTPACLELARAGCAIGYADAEALSARGEHAAALAIFEALAFAPSPGCTSSRALGYRAAREAAAAGDPAHARALVQRTVDEHGYPLILRGSPYGHHRWRLRPAPTPTP